MKKLAALVLALALLLALFACGKAPAAIPNPPLVLGEKYLTDLDYEQAILQFDQAIRIEPKNPRGYLGKADALLHLDRQADAADAIGAAAKQCKPQRTVLNEAKTAVGKSLAEGFAGLATAYEKLGWKDLALALLRRVCEELPEDSLLREALEKFAQEALARSKEEIENLETVKITDAEYNEVKAFITTPLKSWQTFCVRVGIDGDRYIRDVYSYNVAQSEYFTDTYEQFLEFYINEFDYSSQNRNYDIHSIQKISLKGTERYTALYNGQTYSDWIADLKQAVKKNNQDATWIDEVEQLVRLYFEARLPLGSVAALYKADVTTHSTNGDTSSSNRAVQYIVKTNGKLQGVMMWYNSEAGAIV